jgi:hypothetical protein
LNCEIYARNFILRNQQYLSNDTVLEGAHYKPMGASKIRQSAGPTGQQVLKSFHEDWDFVNE